MIVIACLECKAALRVVGDYEQMEFLLGEKSDWYPDKYPCRTDDCKGHGQYMKAITPDALNRLDIADLTPPEAFAALHGMGIPEERECGALAVKKAFGESPVKHVEARHIKGTNRCTVDHIELEDGRKLFFGSSGFGAVIYRISTPHSYAEALNG